MNNIILNGVNSNTISGLLISTLPAISKPKIRTNIEEIDGRDGDIVTKLGYAAYDKTVTIGLHGSFNINDVIKYFNSEGTVIFSNESDKYYKYQIINQINFERLIRFRTADVTFHVQPFKYSTTNNSQTFNITNQTSISITNSGNIYSKPIIKLTGTGTINLSLNNNQIFVIELGDTSTTITIDTNLMEAYNNTSLMNRSVTGNYNNFKLDIGSNTISWSGTLTQIILENYSRWL